MPAADPVRSALGSVRDADQIVTAMRAAEDLAHRASVTTDVAATTRLLVEALDDDGDQLLTIAAVHALSATPGSSAVDELAARLGDGRWHLSEHAGWALSARPVHRPAVRPLVDAVAEGGFNGMLAQRTLAGWSTGDPRAVAAALLWALDTTDADGARRRLTETLGLVPDSSVDARLAVIAADAGESLPTRIAATSAIGDRGLDQATLLRLADEPEPLGQHALLALIDLDRAPGSSVARSAGTSASTGLRVAQLFLHADLEADPGRAGAGDNGGIATLLWLLSASMADHPAVEEVITISRGHLADALASTWLPDQPERFAGVVFGPDGGVDLRGAWPYRVQIERGLRRVVASVGRLDAIHLRLADVGTLAAARVARRLDIPVVFTAAPDPHVVIRSLESDGALTRANFGESDALEHWWFRARMVERLTAHADRLALLPRVGIADGLRDLLGHDLHEDGGRSVLIPEGVHAGTVADAARDVGDARPPTLPSGLAQLVDAVAALPAERRRLPLIVTVGRLHPLKGIDRIVRAWATHPILHVTANLVVVGGDLDNPSPDELDVLTTIDDIVGGRGEPGRCGLVLLGHRPHGDVARILAAAAGGSELVPGGGIYVGGARKEEFGLAIVEGLAAGLPVVAPIDGGPATYVRDGVTGVLVDTTSVRALADGMERALALAATPGRAGMAARDVLDHLTIEDMAERLVELYRSAARVVA